MCVHVRPLPGLKTKVSTIEVSTIEMSPVYGGEEGNEQDDNDDDEVLLDVCWNLVGAFLSEVSWRQF